MAKKANIVLSEDAQQDVRNILKWSERQFGKPAALRYDLLLKQAFRDIRDDPARPGSQVRSDAMPEGTRVYHLRFSRDRASFGVGLVKNPRHFVLYRSIGEIIEIGRILHDARDLPRHISDR